MTDYKKVLLHPDSTIKESLKIIDNIPIEGNIIYDFSGSFTVDKGKVNDPEKS